MGLGPGRGGLCDSVKDSEARPEVLLLSNKSDGDTDFVFCWVLQPAWAFYILKVEVTFGNDSESVRNGKN